MKQALTHAFTCLMAALRIRKLLPHVVVLIGAALVGNATCLAQSQSSSEPASAPSAKQASEQSPTQPVLTSAATPDGQKPLTNDERAELLKIIRSLQERVEKLEAAQAAPSRPPSPAEPTQ